VKEQGIKVRVEQRVSAISADAWNACARASDAEASPEQGFNPFVSYEFLNALEESGCVTAETGWLPQHLVVEDKSGNIAGCMPCYLKGHSQGEYVFDHAWADALERGGVSYYPKLQVSVPFSPVNGPRFLIGPDHDIARSRKTIVDALLQLNEHFDSSSIHLTFLPKDQWDFLGKQGFLQRTDQQFHWFNKGYEAFDDFLGDLSSRKRKNIRREREKAAASGCTFEWLTGNDIKEHHWDAFYQFYLDTGARKWGRPYLNRTFFSLLGERLKQSVLLIMVKRDGDYIAGALNLFGGGTLYGRHWGCVEDLPFLHFETCYYQAIEYAIANKFNRVEAGAQGPHKLARGYLPVTTYSAHYIAHEGLRNAVAQYLRGEREHLEIETRYLGQHSPFRKDKS
jgi:uncharacterized protein